MQREVPEYINIAACKLAKSKGVKTILDVGGADEPFSTELLSLLDIISPNKTELKRILNKDVNVDDYDELLSAVKEMRSISNNSNLNVLVKLGSKGSIYIDENDKLILQSAFKFDDMEIVDTTGAGDCFTASFVTQLLEGKSVEDSLVFSTAAAYKCITKFGAMPSLPVREEVEALIKRNGQVKSG